jgi:crossover junction endodeoxyribonuclease RusA
MTKKGKALKESYTLQAESQCKKVFKGDVEMTIMLYFGDKRRRDVDNYNKLILDSLEGICYKDDKQVQTLVVTKMYDKEIPRSEIYIRSQEA